MDLASVTRTAVTRTAVYLFTSAFEGESPNLYSCTAGRITVGVGCVVSLADALALPWVIDGRPGTPDEITRDYQTVAVLPAGHLASWYAPHTRCRLAADTIRALFDRRAAAFVHELERAFPDFDAWPQGAQIATADWVFNCGLGALLATQHLAPALHAHRWADAANACHRAG